MEYTRTQEIKFGIEVPVCTSFAYRLFLSCEIAIAKIAGSTEQQMFKNEILSVFLITVTKSLEFSKIFLKYFLGKKTIATEILMFLVLFAIAGFEIAGIYLTSIVMIYIFMLYFPKISQKHQYDDLNFELPYALRHMATELKAGKGLHDTLLTVSIANYGSLSGEFKRVLKEIKYGKSSEDALMEMSLRVSSEGLSRAVHQLSLIHI